MPYPANYGGVIDVFYKLIELKKLGIEITLHTFEYGRKQQKELEKYCVKVHYYNRNSFLKSLLSKEPFIVKSRANKALIKNLTDNDFPILFEGLHTTFPIFINKFSTQKVYVRTHNIEHLFYKGLSDSERNIPKKIFFKQEANRLYNYEPILNKVDGIFTISPYEQDYFSKKYGNKATYIPVFHEITKFSSTIECNDKFVLYHGNIAVSENVKAALFLIDVYKNSSFKLIIASSHHNKKITSEIKKYKNIQFSLLKSDNDLKNLFKKAHINALPTFQKTGIKLKLLNALYQGKFVIANNKMVDDTGLENNVEKANTKEEFLQKTAMLFDKKFDQETINKRLESLKKFNTEKSAEKIKSIIFE